VACVNQTGDHFRPHSENTCMPFNTINLHLALLPTFWIEDLSIMMTYTTLHMQAEWQSTP